MLNKLKPDYWRSMAALPQKCTLMVFLQNFQKQNVKAYVEMSQQQNVPSPKTSQPQNIPIQNVLSLKTSQASKRPNPKMSQLRGGGDSVSL